MGVYVDVDVSMCTKCMIYMYMYIINIHTVPMCLYEARNFSFVCGYWVGTTHTCPSMVVDRTRERYLVLISSAKRRKTAALSRDQWTRERETWLDHTTEHAYIDAVLN